jgi:DegV family protein with EDD domain
MSAPAGVAVVVDSTHYLPPALVAANDLHEVSLYVGWAGDLRRESEVDDLDAFYARLRSEPEVPRTSQPSVGDFLDVYRPLVAAGRDIASIHLASGLSGTCASAREASGVLQAEGAAGRVAVFDSQSGAAGLGALGIVASRAAAGGAALDEVVGAVASARAQLDLWFCLDTLEFLRKGGRIGAAQAMLGSALRIKPILTFGTEITPVERVRTSRRAFERLVEYLRGLHDRGATAYYVQHIQDPEGGERLVEEGRAIFGGDPLFCSEVGPVLGAHLGPGMLGLGGLVL